MIKSRQPPFHLAVKPDSTDPIKHLRTEPAVPSLGLGPVHEEMRGGRAWRDPDERRNKRGAWRGKHRWKGVKQWGGRMDLSSERGSRWERKIDVGIEGKGQKEQGSWLKEEEGSVGKRSDTGCGWKKHSRERWRERKGKYEGEELGLEGLKEAETEAMQQERSS